MCGSTRSVVVIGDCASNTFLIIKSEGKFSTIDSHTDIPKASVADKRAPNTHVWMFSGLDIKPHSCACTAHTVRYE